jgi:N,N'-diacetyllegionaminate synthase
MKNSASPVLIFECANSHGGDQGLLEKILNDFSQVIYPNRHIKFQPLHPDKIAMPDYEWYGVYKELFFNQTQWSSIINLASSLFDGVWIDVFDVYGVEIFKENFSSVTGLKLQASVLDNQEVLNALKSLDYSSKSIMLNISGYEISEIDFFIKNFQAIAPEASIILQIGFQGYPTKLEDTGLQKINIFRSAFPQFEICIADHISAENDLSTILPLLAVSVGCNMVEKHIAFDRATAKYDKFSALHVNEMQLLANRLASCPSALSGPYISLSESQYLAKTIQIPVLNKSVTAGSLLSISDFIFRRTNKKGSTYNQLHDIQNQGHIVNKDISVGDTVNSSDFKKAKIGAIVACRMKSSRLKSKATLEILGKSSVERCLENTLKIEGIDEVVLATSTLEEDAVLKKFDLDGKIKFWQGDPDDVISRYIGACEAFDIDVIVRITADCPLVSSEIAKVLLEHHFESGADYTAAKNCAVGTACEIYNTEALKRVIKLLGHAEYSEYMTWYLQNNQHVFKVELVDLPEDMVRDYRLTLDHPEDLELFCRLYEKLADAGLDTTLKNVFKILDEDKSLAKINSHLSLKYKTDQDLIEHLNKVTKISLT